MIGERRLGVMFDRDDWAEYHYDSLSQAGFRRQVEKARNSTFEQSPDGEV